MLRFAEREEGHEDASLSVGRVLRSAMAAGWTVLSVAGLAACGAPAAGPSGAPTISAAGTTFEASLPRSHSVPGRCELPALASLGLINATVTSTIAIATGSYRPDGWDDPLNNLPAFCRITGTATPTADSEIGFELWIPDGDAWNGKMVTTGNGGYNPAKSYADMAYALRQGYATIGGDTGHTARDSSSLRWGVGHPEKVTDWAERSINAITMPGRQIVAALQGRPVSRNYYYGCSTGGHQAYAEVQKYPQDFDGVIAGAPANNWVGLSTEGLWRFRANRTPVTHQLILTPQKAELIARSSIAACDALDGVVDGIVADPRACTPARFDVASLQCTGEDNDDCLTAAQVAAAKRLYQGATNPRTGEALYPGPVVGTESGWSGYWRDTAPARLGFWGLWLSGDERWDPWTFDFDTQVAAARAKLGPIVDHLDPDLGRFKARSGKLITYQGWADPVISALDTVHYYESVRKAQGSQAATDQFFRLFMVPGMGHCGGGPGANVFGNAGNASPAADSGSDLLMALDRWVEHGEAPARLIAADVEDGVVSGSGLLCSYPAKAVYRKGDASDAASYACE